MAIAVKEQFLWWLDVPVGKQNCALRVINVFVNVKILAQGADI